MDKKVIIVGPAHPLRSGGISTFNQRLCKAFLEEGYECSIFSFSLQYPSFLFPGKTQFTREPAPEGIRIYSVINSIHPFNWIHVGNQIRNLKPDIVVVRFWIPFMGPSLGTILRRVRKNRHTRIVAITDNIIPHEKRPGDRAFTRYFLRSCDAFITLSEGVLKDLREFEPVKPARRVLHPLYDNFGNAVSREEARHRLGIDSGSPLLLFFGFIRHYKGLDLLLKAMGILARKARTTGEKVPTLLIAGEFYEDEKPYQDLIDELEIRGCLDIHNHFIPDEEVKYYLSAADVVVQPYRDATQSGVTPLAYHFEIPMIVTRVGSLPEQVPDGKAGLVCEPEPSSLASAIEEYLKLGKNHFLPQLRREKEKYSWPELVHTIAGLACEITH